MAPRVTSSRDRARGRASRPVTTSRGRANRQSASSARVTNSSSRTSTGSARVTRNQSARSPGNARGRIDNTRPASPSSTGRSLPAAGGTTGSTPRARTQAGWARDRGARAQAERVLRTTGRVVARMAGIDRQSLAGARAERAARGTRGEGTRVVGPNGANPRQQRLLTGNGSRVSTNASGRPALPGTTTSSGWDQVRGRGTRTGQPGSARQSLPGAQRPEAYQIRQVQVTDLGNTQRQLPPGRQGGTLATRQNARTSTAQQRAGRAAAGSRGTGARTGRPAGTTLANGGGVRTGGGPVTSTRPTRGVPQLPPGRSTAQRVVESTQRAVRNATQRRGAQPSGINVQTTGGALRAGATSLLGGALFGLLDPYARAVGRQLGRQIEKIPGVTSAREQRLEQDREVARISRGDYGRSRAGNAERTRQARMRSEGPSPSRSNPPAERPSSRPQQQSGGVDPIRNNPPAPQLPPPPSVTAQQYEAPAPQRSSGQQQGNQSQSAPETRTRDAQGFFVPGSPLVAEPAPMPTSRQQGGGGNSSERPSSSSSSGSSSQRPLSSSSNSERPRDSRNPGYGTSKTNNPLLINDPYLMGKMKEREARNRGIKAATVSSKASEEYKPQTADGQADNKSQPSILREIIDSKKKKKNQQQ